MIVQKNKFSLQRKKTFSILLLAVTASAPAAAMAMEAKVFAIEDFVSTASGGCGGGDRSHWANMVDHWYDEMGAQGNTKDGQYTDGNMTLHRFCDPDWMSGCQDHNFIDEADAVMIATHGSDSGDHWAGTMRYPWNGQCALDGGGSSGEMRAGDYDLEFIHVSSCYSADDDNLPGIRNAMYDPADPSSHAHQWDGFHGLMWIGSSFDSDYEDFADDAHSVAMSRSWVNNLYDNTVDCDWYDPFDWFGTCVDQCPVAYTTSTSGANALTRLLYERYNNVYSDPTGHGGYAYRYIAGCDPGGESAFSP